MNFNLLIFSILYFWVVSLNAQEHADCASAQSISGNSIHIESVDGPGNMEIKGFELGNEKHFTEEHNTVWLKYKVADKGKLSFDLLPDVATDDWDFMIFRFEDDACTKILSGELQPVRSNLARNNPALKGKTGLSKDAEKAFQPAGVHPNYSSFLEVSAAEAYLIAIDINENKGNGFTLNFKLEVEAPPLPPPAVEEVTEEDDDFGFVDMTEDESNAELMPITFQIFSEKSKEPIRCKAEVKGVYWEAEDVSLEESSEFKIEVPKDKWFYFNVRKDGYTFSSEKYKATDELSAKPQIIYIEKVETGEHIVLKEIVFRENTTQLLPTSINALEKLIEFMNEYPNARIEIQGHVNAPGFDNSGKVKRMSVKRAEQIKQFLVDAEEDGRRIEVRGMGNEHMIYPEPSNYEEEKANRRVEIEILSL